MDILPSITEAFKQVRTDIVNLQLQKGGPTAGPDLYSEINWNERIWVAHRCGPLVYPEQSAEALEAVYQTGGGLIPEIDIQELNDGTFVVNHDATVERTMHNMGSGVTESKSREQWRQGKVKAAIPGGTLGTPLFWEDVMDKYGGKMMMFVELKKEVSPESVDRFCQEIVRRGLQRSMIVFCFNYDVCVEVSHFGIEVLFLNKDNPTQSAATMLADGIRHLGTSALGNMTAAQITAFKTAGIKVFQYTIETRDLLQATLLKNPNGIISNDPWMHSDRIKWRGQDPFADGIRPHGMEVYGHTGGEAVVIATDGYPLIEYPISLIGAGLGFPTSKNVNTRNAHATQPWAGKFKPPFNLGFRIQFGAGSGVPEDQKHNAGVSFYNVDNHPLFVDDAWPNQEAWTFVFRRSGAIGGYRARPGVKPAGVPDLTTTPVTPSGGANQDHVAPIPGAEFAPLNKMGVVFVEIMVTNEMIKIFTNSFATSQVAGTAASTLGQTQVLSHVPSPIPANQWYALALRFPTSGDASISEVRLTPHPAPVRPPA